MLDATDPNEAQAQRVARLMADAFKADIQPQTNKWVGSAPAWLGVIVAVGGILSSAVFVAGDVDENRRRIDKLEVEVRQQSASSQQVLERLASIEAKLDLITEERKQ